MRTIIVGDVHGCAAALSALLNRLAPENDDMVIMLGDLFDRGPDSYHVFQIVRQLAEKMGERFILLRGNHEDYLLQAKLSFLQRLTWDKVGKSTTVRSFKENGARMEDSIPWLEANCRMYWKGDGIQCVHAGLLIDPLELNDTETMIHDHGVVLRNTYNGPLTVVGHIALAEPTYFYGDGKTTEKLTYNTWLRLPEKGTVCIDTGCGKGGRLTAMIVNGDQYSLESIPENG